jgi:hypothetical protein
VSEREGRNTVVSDIGNVMVTACRVRLECEEGGSEVCDGCKKCVERTEIK